MRENTTNELKRGHSQMTRSGPHPIIKPYKFFQASLASGRNTQMNCYGKAVHSQLNPHLTQLPPQDPISEIDYQISKLGMSTEIQSKR